MSNMKVLGITGGVGSGKSAVAAYLRDNYNLDLIIADEVAKELMAPNGACYERLFAEFSDLGVFGEDKALIPAVMAEKVFSNEELLNKLNSIVHPAVKVEIGSRVARAKEEGRLDAIMIEAALFLGGEYDTIIEDYIYVYVDMDTRIERLAAGRSYTRQKSESIMANQPKDEDFRAFCKYELDNSAEFETTCHSADQLMESLDIGLSKKQKALVGDKSMDREYVFGLDIGTRNVVGTVGYMDEEIFRVIAQCTMEHKSRSMLDGQIHDIEKVSKVVEQVKENLEEKIDFKLSNVCIAAAGRVLQTVTTNVTYEYPTESIVTGEDLYTLDLLGVDKAHRELTHDDDRYKFYCVGYTVMKYYLNGEIFSSLEGHKADSISEDVIVTFLPQDVVDGLYSAVERAGLNVANLTLEPIAAINVAIPESFRMLNIALVDVGAGTSDICITDDGSIIAYGMIPYAGDEITEVLVKEYLVDFANAENMKKAAAAGEEVHYKDIMGIEHTTDAESVRKITEPVLEKITTSVCEKIVELNADKPVQAVFVVGGGGKAHGFTKLIADKLGILQERVALRGEDVMEMIEFEQEEIVKDPLLVTPIGICLNYYQQRNSFIMIRFNGEIMKLYDNGYLKVVDAALQAGLTTEEIFPKRGKQINFTVNGISRMARGGRGESAKVFMNGREVGLNDNLLPNSEIRIEPSTEGEEAVIRIEDLEEFSDIYVNFVVNGTKVRAPKFVEVNGELATGDYQIKNGDDIETRAFYTVGQLAEFMDVELEPDHGVLVNNRPASMDTILYENFNIDWTLLEAIDTDEPVTTFSIPTISKEEQAEMALEESKDSGEEPEERTEQEAKAESEVEVDPGSEDEPETEPNESRTESEEPARENTESEFREPVAESEASEAETNPESDSEAEAEPEAESESEPAPEPEAETEAEPEKDAEPEAEPTDSVKEEVLIEPSPEEEARILREKAMEEKANQINSMLRDLEEEGPEEHDINIRVNDTPITLTGKREYIFVDIYNFYEFNPESAKGKRIVIKVNGNTASFADAIHDGDEISLYWEER